MTSTQRSAVKGVEKLVVWPLTADTEATLTYGAATAFVKALMTVQDTPTIVEGELPADNQIVESDVEVTGGTLVVGLTALNESDRVLLYGNEIAKGTVITHKDDLAGYVAVAYMTIRSDGKVNLYKKLKVRFAPSSESYSTKQSSGISYATININGKYIPTIHDGNIAGTRYGVDPVADAVIITSWFTEADYLGPEA